MCNKFVNKWINFHIYNEVYLFQEGEKSCSVRKFKYIFTNFKGGVLNICFTEEKQFFNNSSSKSTKFSKCY